MKNNKIETKIISEDKLNINEPIDIPVKHQQIVLERIAKAKTNPERLLNWDEVSKNL